MLISYSIAEVRMKSVVTLYCCHKAFSLQGETTYNNLGPNAVLTFYHVHRPWKPDVLYFPAFQFIASLTA